MAEYIEKQAVIDEVDEWYNLYPDSDTAREALSLLRKAIKKISPEDVRPVVRGEWIDERWYDLLPWTPVPYLCFATCSACKQESIVNIKRGKKEWEIDSDICPRCGSYNGADVMGGDAECPE